jgi:hypothetical protein
VPVSESVATTIRHIEPIDVPMVVDACRWLFDPPGAVPPLWDAEAAPPASTTCASPTTRARSSPYATAATARDWARDRGATHLMLGALDGHLLPS